MLTTRSFRTTVAAVLALAALAAGCGASDRGLGDAAPATRATEVTAGATSPVPGDRAAPPDTSGPAPGAASNPAPATTAAASPTAPAVTATTAANSTPATDPAAPSSAPSVFPSASTGRLGSGALIPAAVGNQWEYRVVYPDPIGSVTYVQEVTAVAPNGENTDVTMRSSFHYENGSNPDFAVEHVYTYHPDGSLSIPYNAFSLGDVSVSSTGTGGAILWPSAAELRAGASRTGHLDVEVSLADATEAQGAVDFSAAGAGTEDVAAPAGTFPGAVVMDLQLDITITSDELGAPMQLPVGMKIWFAEGVGIVRQEVSGDFVPGTAVELLSTNVGA